MKPSAQAAPFRTEATERSSAPSRPGRKGRHKASYRPGPEQVDTHVDVPVACCPACEGPVSDVRPIRQVIEEIPPITPQVAACLERSLDALLNGCKTYFEGLSPKQTLRTTGLYIS